MDNIFKNIINDMGKKKVVIMISAIVLVILLIFFLSFIRKLMGVRISYEELEKKLAASTEKYMNDNPNSLPIESNPTVVVNATTLIENKYIKSLKKYVKDSSCTANINVYYVSGKYEYQPFLTCDDFKTEKFNDILKAKNEISSFGDGLYELNNEFVYRGQNPDNYLKFNGELWRILKINTEGKFIIIKNDFETKDYGVWDNRYNSEVGTQKGNNTFSLSRVLSSIKEIYKEKYSKQLDYLTTYDVCAGKRSEADNTKDGNVECSSLLKDQYIGLLPVYDYLNASLDSLCLTTSSKECQNYNYLVNNNDKWWTVTGNSKSSYHVYFIDTAGQIDSEDAAISATYRYVLALNKNVLYKKGSGTLEDPYEIR